MEWKLGTTFLVLGLVLWACGGGDMASPSTTLSSVSMPDLEGSTAAFAKSTLENLGVSVEIVEVDANGAAPGTVVSVDPPPGSSTQTGAIVVIRVATEVVENTTTTTEPAPAAPDEVVQYFHELARGTVGGYAAAEAAARGLAATYAGYLGALGGQDPSDVSAKDDGSFSLCSEVGGATSCLEYSELVLHQDRVSSFDVNGRSLRTVLWRHDLLRDDGVCFSSDDSCNFKNPEQDKNSYALPAYAYRTAAGELAFVIDVISGQDVFDVIWDSQSQRLQATATKEDGSVSHAHVWWTYPDVAVGIENRLRIPASTRTNLILFFPGYENGAVATTVEVEVDMGGGRYTFEADLPNLTD